MPFWQVEGLALYGLLCGYTVYGARAASQRPPSYGFPESRWSSTR